MTAKVCAIVLAVSNTPEQFISEVARCTGLPASTAHRLLCELVEGGLLERNTAGRFTVCVELQLLHGPGKRAAHARSLVGTMRSVGTLPDDPLLHVCVAAYASDMTLLDSVLLAQRLAWAENTVTGASLDHAMWFHAPFRAYDWLLHVQEAPATSGARARTHQPPRRAPRGIRRVRRANPRPPITPTLSNHGGPRIRHRKPHNT